MCLSTLFLHGVYYLTPLLYFMHSIPLQRHHNLYYYPCTTISKIFGDCARPMTMAGSGLCLCNLFCLLTSFVCVAAKSIRPWRGVPYKECTRLSDNNSVAAHCHHNQNSLLIMDFHQWEESLYIISHLIGVLSLEV